GKSSTLMHLERKWNAAAKDRKFAPRMLYFPTPRSFVHGELLKARVAETLKPGLGKRMRRHETTEISYKLGYDSAGFEKVTRSGSEPPADPIDAVLQRFPAKKWKRPLVVAIDEFQTSAGDDTSAHARVLQALHGQEYHAPIMVVLAGLGDTVSRAAQLGISRLASGASHSLGCFTPDESSELIVGWGRHFGLPEGVWQDEMQTLAAELDHWTLHVQHALTAFAEQVVACGGVEDVDFAAVRKRSRGWQLNYYYSRMSYEMGRSECLLAVVMGELTASSRHVSIIRAIESKYRPEAGWRLPKGMDADGFFEHLVHRGALQKLPDGSVHCPIPSFRRYMIGLGEHEDGGG
ncbi:MAG: hypothetical protein OXB95_07765, partial [Rhodobacteraceae bacterium]|nr:hypothetical protein [Paracoccaceae bacterium]